MANNLLRSDVKRIINNKIKEYIDTRIGIVNNKDRWKQTIQITVQLEVL